MSRGEHGHARSLRADLRRLAGGASAISARADGVLREVVKTDPVLAVGAAACLGFVIGGGLPRGAVTVLLGIGTRMGGEWLQDQFLGSPSTQEKEPS